MNCGLQYTERPHQYGLDEAETKYAPHCSLHLLLSNPSMPSLPWQVEAIANKRNTCLSAQRVGIQLPRARRRKPSKNERSRARSGQLQCRVGPPLANPALLPCLGYVLLGTGR